MTTSLRNSPLPPAPASDIDNTIVEVCTRCGESRERALFYASDCRDDGQWIGDKFVPGPSLGEHIFARMTLRESIYGRSAS
jgi:hypothetical protein